MLEDKTWKTEAVLRLILSVFICVCAGSLLAAVVLRGGAAPKALTPRVMWVGSGALLCLLGALGILSRPWPIDGFFKRMTVFLVLFYAGMSLGAWVSEHTGPPANSVWQMVFAALGFQGAGLILITFFLREHGTGFGEALGLRRFAGPAILLGVISAILFLPMGWALQQVSSFLITHVPALHLKPVEQQSVQTLRTASMLTDRLALGVVTIILAPLAEETLFRGILYPWIKGLGFPRLALWGSAMLFALVHLNMATFLPLLCLAVVLTWLYEFTGNLLASITTHALFNALNFALLLLLGD